MAIGSSQNIGKGESEGRENVSVPSIVLFGIDIVRFFIDLGTTYLLFLAVSLTLNLEAGFSGIPNFGKVMFVAGGAAVAGSVSGRLAALILSVDTSGYNFNIARIIGQVNAALSNNPILSMELLLLGVALAAGIGGALGYLASLPAIRLREDYLGMLLLAAAQLFSIILGGVPQLVGGTIGLEVPDVFAWAETGIEVRDVVVLGFLVVFAALVYVYCERIARSPLGRTLRAIRDNEVASRSLGKDDVAFRRNVIIIGSAISGMAGALLTFYVGSINSDWPRITWTFWIWVMVILGGAGNNLGVALGAFAFTFLLKVTNEVKFYFQSYVPFDVNWLEYLVFASLLILILIFRAGGILPEKSTTTLPWQTVNEMMRPQAQSEDKSVDNKGPDPG